MGISWSSRRRREEDELFHSPHLPSIPSLPSPPIHPPTPPPAHIYGPYFPSQPLSLPPAPPPSSSSPYSYLPVPTPPPHLYFHSPPQYCYPIQGSDPGSSGFRPQFMYYGPYVGRSGYHPAYAPNHVNGWWPSSSSNMSVPQRPVAPFVDHQNAKTIKNDVNLHKDTIRLVPDEQHPDQHLVSFVYDAVVDGRVTIFYFGQEGVDCRFSTIYPDMYSPAPIPFEKGVHKQFHQPSGSGIDLGFFDLNSLSKPLPGDIFPLVIYAEADPQNEQTKSSHAQITQAVVNKDSDGIFSVKVVKQILWIDGERYELREIFGIENVVEDKNGHGSGDYEEDMGKDCVICLSEPRNTAVLPCRHMCMCRDCAKELSLRSNVCPICRQSFDELMEIKVNSPVVDQSEPPLPVETETQQSNQL